MTKSSMPRPAPHSCSASAAQLASFSQNTSELRAPAEQRAQVGPRGALQVRREGQATVPSHHSRQSDADRHLARTSPWRARVP